MNKDNTTICFALFLIFFSIIFPGMSDAQDELYTSPDITREMVAQIFWKIVIWGDHADLFLLNRLKIDLLPDSLQADAEKFVQAYHAFESRLKAPKEADKNSPDYEWITSVYFQQQVRRERSMVALLPGTEAEAAAYVSLNPGCYEWEGLSGCPRAEAQFAETYIQNFPETPLKPYLLLLLMHRYRAITECQDVVNDPIARNAALTNYHRYLYEVRESDSPLIVYLANAINMAPFVYTDQFLQKQNTQTLRE